MISQIPIVNILPRRLKDSCSILIPSSHASMIYDKTSSHICESKEKVRQNSDTIQKREKSLIQCCMKRGSRNVLT